MGEKDVEAAKPASIPYFQQILDHAGITPEVQNWHYDGSGTDEDPYVVVWIDHDPRNPMLYGIVKKWSLVAVVAMATLAVAFCSSAYSGGAREIMQEFNASQELFTAGVSLFVMGFAVGPLIWAPLSELFGRQYLFSATYLGLSVFNAAAAGAPNIWSLLIFRFFAGAIGSSPLTNAGGVIADMFPARDRGLAMSLFAVAPFMGPVLGPIVGGFVGQTIGWRWIMGIMAIFTGTLWIIGTVLIPETYPPVLLRARAKKLSQMTGKVYKTRGDIDSGDTSIGEIFKISLSRPWVLLFREPIVFLLSIYMAIIYGTLYMCFGAFPVVYQQGRHWSPGIGGLAFIGVAVGMIFAIAYSIWDNKRYARISDEYKGFAPPESRLPFCMVGACAVPIGLFWFAWTNGPSVHWIVSIIAGAPFGFGMVLIFLGIMNYLIDSYTIFAASVLAANSVLRSLFGAAFPLFTSQMYSNLGIHWASTVPAFLALACVPFPFLFYKYGARIRVSCKYAAESEKFMRQMQGQVLGSDDSTPDKTPARSVSYSAASPGSTDLEKREDSEHARRESHDTRDRTAAEEVEEPHENWHDAPATADGSPRFESIVPTKSRTQTERGYDLSPFDLDRVNTRDSFRRTRSHSTLGRTKSRASSKSGR